jgi:hypothetical protein
LGFAITHAGAFVSTAPGSEGARERGASCVIRTGSGIRFDYLVVDGLYPGAPFLHLADRLRLPVVARLKENLPERMSLARARTTTDLPLPNTHRRTGRHPAQLPTLSHDLLRHGLKAAPASHLNPQVPKWLERAARG